MTLFQLLGPETIDSVPLANSTSQLIAVWGSSGSGKTLLSINLAFEIASLGNRVLLIDGDSYGPGIAPALGVTDPGPGILAALRLARQGRLDQVEISRLSQELSFEKQTLRFLPGVTTPLRWSDFDGVACQGLIATAREHFDVIVVDVAPNLEPGIYTPESSVSRNQASLGFIEAADLVLGLFAADAIGVNRFLWDLRMANFDYWPIANRVRSQAVGLSPERQLRDAIYKLAHRELNHLLPQDSGAIDTALQRAQPLLVAARNSKLREAIRRLAIDVLSASTKLPNREH